MVGTFGQWTPTQSTTNRRCLAQKKEDANWGCTPKSRIIAISTSQHNVITSICADLAPAYSQFIQLAQTKIEDLLLLLLHNIIKNYISASCHVVWSLTVSDPFQCAFDVGYSETRQKCCHQLIFSMSWGCIWKSGLVQHLGCHGQWPL